MKTNSFTVIGFLLILLSATQVSAVTLSLEPSVQTATPGDAVTLDLVIDGLGNFAPDSLGDFDIDIAFDPVALSFVDYSLGPYLGDLDLFEATDFSFGDLGGGLVNLAEVSFLLPFELDLLQPGSFSLATLEFMVNVLPLGSSTPVNIDTVWAIGDGFGDSLTLDSTNEAVIQNVPEPTILALMGLGLAGIGYRRKKAA